MTYDIRYWDGYAASNEARYSDEFAGFVAGLAGSLRCGSVLEAGCGTGIDLRRITGPVLAAGADLNAVALGMAARMMPTGLYARCGIERLPFGDSSVDMVFTHGLLNHLDEGAVEAGTAELYRVSSKYVASFEEYLADEGRIDDRRHGRNMGRRWAGMGARIISDVQMHPDIDGTRFTLAAKR